MVRFCLWLVPIVALLVVAIPGPGTVPAYRTSPTPTPYPEVLRQVAVIVPPLDWGIRRLLIAPDGMLWVIARDAIGRLEEGEWAIYLTEIPGVLVGLEPAGRAWVVAEDGRAISAWDGTAWTDYGAEQGWVPVAMAPEFSRWWRIWGASDHLGRYWLPTEQDVRFFDGEAWETLMPPGVITIEHESTTPYFGVTVLESTGDIWVYECEWRAGRSTEGQGARWFDGQTWHGADSPVASGCVLDVQEDSAGRVWIVEGASLWRYDHGEWTHFAPPEVPSGYSVFGWGGDLVLDPSGDPWIMLVLCGGASCSESVRYHIHDDGTWTPIMDTPSSGHNSLILDQAGTPWLFYEGGLYRINDDRAEHVSTISAWDATLDANGLIWFTTMAHQQTVLMTFDPAAVP